MFKSIFIKEINRNFTSVSFYIFTLIMLILTIMTVQNVNPNMVVLFPIRKEWHNAPLIIAKFFAVLSVYGLLFTIVMVGRSAAKDFSVKIHEFFFTLPISKLSYLGGRFIGGLSANVLIFIGVVIGLFVGTLMIEPKFFGPFSLEAFITPIIFILIPNLLLSGSIFFSFATLSRKMAMTYVSGVILLMLYGFLSLGLLFIDNDTIKILIDPFAISSLNTITENWTVTEINNNPMPLTGLFLLNRLLWFSVASLIMLITWKKFKFASFLETRKQKKSDPNNEKELIANINYEPVRIHLIDNSFFAQVQKCLHITIREFKRIVFHPAFIILTLLAASTTFMNFYMNVDYGGNNVYPTTSWYLEQCNSILGYTIPMIIFFGGIIVWRERDYSTNQIFDTLPLRNWTGYLAKLFALFSILFLFMLVIILTGIFTQVFLLNWMDLELGLYVRWLFGIEMLYYWFLAVLILFILNLAKNKYLGFFICALFIAADIIIFAVFRSELSMFRYGHIPSFIYSDINGFGHYAEIIIWYTLHWILFALLLGLLTSLTWRRNEEIAIKYRLRSLKENINDIQKFSIIILLILITGTINYISYNKYIVNDYLSHDDRLEMMANYEKNYSQFMHMPQPSIFHINLNVDFFPKNRDAKIRGTYFLKNKTSKSIDTVFVNLSERKITTIKSLQFSRPIKLLQQGQEFGFRIYELDEPLIPGDSISLSFDLEANTEGFSDNNPKDELAENGSRLSLTVWGANEYFPTIGYDDDYNLTSSTYREEFNLSLKDLYPKPEDVKGKISSIKKPFITYDAILSTSLGQITITNGDLVNHWSENNRNYHRYKSDIPMSCEIQIISGKYEVRRERQNNVDIEVYYNKRHPWNVDRIIRGAKQSLLYCSENFAVYPYNTFKVVEIPKYMKKGGARAQPSLIIWREDVGFLSQVDDADGIDQLFGITAHELTHNWWPDIVIPAHAAGLEMMAEAIAEYVRIMSVEKEYGKKMAIKHLKREMDTYLSRRSRDLDGERPFKYALPKQYYISYQKATAAMYALQDYIGEQNVNLALRRITEKYGFSEDEHPTSIDLINEYRKVTPDTLQYLITDLFEKITLYENEIVSAKYIENKSGSYRVNLSLKCKKFYADSIGNQHEVPIEDYVYIGVFGEGGEELYMRKHKFSLNETEIEITVNKPPVKAGIDPNVILIDRNGENNMIDVARPI